MLEDKEIIDTTKEEWLDIYESGWYEKLDEEYLEWHGYESSVAKVLIERQSDNLLDLLEVGDCIENTDGDIFSANNLFEKEMMKRWANNKAIWKRNGDIMRRYQIEKTTNT
jgi:hypothetical protein